MGSGKIIIMIFSSTIRLGGSFITNTLGVGYERPPRYMRREESDGTRKYTVI